MKRRCYYEVLEVDSKATADEIKQAYRKMAIKWHPDKNSSDDAKERFQEIGEAYQVLSDPNERTWYDHHKEQILRPSHDPGVDVDSDKYEELLTFGCDIWPYFDRHCFKGFDDTEEGFYAVYRKVFEIIKAEEEKAKNMNTNMDDDDYHEAVGGKAAPGFGDSKTSDEKVVEFYNHWEHFVTYKNFAWKDLHNPNEAGNRYVKRMIEKDNKKERQKEKKMYVDTIRRLVDYVKKRDPRYQEYSKRVMLEKQKKAEEQRRLEEAKKKEMEELKKRRREEEAERYRLEEEARRAQGIVDEDEPGENVHYEEWYCEICDKEFKTENQLENHKQSKAHTKKVKELMQEIMLEEEKKAFEDEEENAEGKQGNEETGRKSKKKKKKNKKKNQKDEEDDEDNEEGKEEKEPAKGKNEKGSQTKKEEEHGKIGGHKKEENESQEEPEEDDDFDFGQFVPKKAQSKKASNKETKKEPVKTEEEKEEPVEKKDEGKEEKEENVEEEKDEGSQNKDEDGDKGENGEEESESGQAGKKLNKAKLKKLKRQEKAKQQGGLVCNVCKASFETRNKLYQHVKESKHEMKVV